MLLLATFSRSLGGFHEWEPQEVCNRVLTLLYFALGVTEGHRHWQELSADSWFRKDQERGRVDGQKARTRRKEKVQQDWTK